MTPGKLFLIAAPSGTGKTTVVEELIETLKKHIPISRVITYTTRPTRPGEVEGRDYFFIDKSTFLKKIAQGFFLEVTNYNGQCYGSPRYFVDDMQQGKSFIMITDRAGVISLQSLIPEAISMWLSPPSLQELERRLKGRGTETDVEIARRLDIAQKEMAMERSKRIFTLHVTNHVIEKTVATLCTFILQQLNVAP